MKKTLRTIKSRSLLYIAAAILVFSSFQQNIAQAFDVNFYSNNDILYYDPSACSVTNQSGDIAVIGNDNAEKIFNFLTTTKFSGLGGTSLNAIQAAGVLGNFQAESSMNPASVENNVPDSAPGDGHGLAQWSYNVSGTTRVGPGRRGILMDLANQQGKQWSDISVQLQMISNELNGSYGAQLLSAGFDKVTTPTDAATIFMQIYEGPLVPNFPKRDSAAQSYYQALKDKAPAATQTTSGGNSSSSSSCSSKASSNFASSSFTFYNQCDAPWGQMTPPANTICYNACGPTSTAMAITNMTGQKVTPLDTTQYVTQNNLWMSPGGGTSFDTNVAIAQKWGLKAAVASQSQVQDINYIKGILDSGGMVMVAGKAGAPRPFYQDGAHFVLIRAITPDGKILIANPAPIGDDNSKQWDAGDIINGNLFGGVAFTK